MNGPYLFMKTECDISIKLVKGKGSRQKIKENRCLIFNNNNNNNNTFFNNYLN